jgi:hypothetical protein
MFLGEDNPAEAMFQLYGKCKFYVELMLKLATKFHMAVKIWQLYFIDILSIFVSKN